MNNKITITMPYYEAPKMLQKHIEVWGTYPSWALEFLKFIVVDDGSPTLPAVTLLDQMDSDLPIELYRIQEDIPWNHGGARNLAFDRMDGGWAVLTDIDHVLPIESVCSLLTMDLSQERVYIPARYRMTGVLSWDEIHRHSDSFILTRDKFFEVGGFDEDFSGFWNGVSCPFRKDLHRKAEFSDIDSVWFLLYGRDMVQDANVSLGRRRTRYDILKTKDCALQKKFGAALSPSYAPKDLIRFNWERVI